jgi:hypothetical protein
MIRVPIRVFRNSHSPLTLSFRSFWGRMGLIVEVITVRGGVPHFLGGGENPFPAECSPQH